MSPDTSDRELIETHKMASLGRLLAGVVHEINTPIGSIFSNNEVILRSLELLKKALTDPQPGAIEKARDIVETCHGLAAVDKIACERISSVVRSLKTFARPDTAEFRETDLNEELQNTLKLAQAEFRRRILVETEFGELPKVQCHPAMLNQVFLNILVNAAQAIEGEGKITVRTSREGDQAHISITDTGQGIQPEDRDKVFAGGFTTKAAGIGTGLGLSISRRIIEKEHNGTITFETEVGAGTTFHIRIPIEQRRSEFGG